MAEIKSESVADFIPESVAALLRNQQVPIGADGNPTMMLAHFRSVIRVFRLSLDEVLFRC
jgi:hypothetical protein